MLLRARVAVLLLGVLLAACDTKTIAGLEVSGQGWWGVGGGPAQYLDTVAIAVYSDGEIRDVTRYASWRSSDEGVATVDGNGLVTKVSPGSVVISATLDGMTGSLPVEVP